MHLTCGNPQCGAPFQRYSGKLRVVPATTSKSIVFLWICASCLNEELALGLEVEAGGDELRDVSARNTC
jgi:hypothetical protein